jgi:hypothetical protein
MPGPFTQPQPSGGPVGPSGGPVGPSGGPILDYGFPPLPQHRAITQDDLHHLWFDIDFLLWWVKPGPSPNPLVTTGSPNDAPPAALGQPNTVILYGGHNIDYDSFSGARASVGYWLPFCPVVGIEGTIFALQSNRVNFTALSDPSGNLIIARPFINAQTGTENSYIDSFPGLATGGISVTSSTRLDSWEINLAINLIRTRQFDWDLLVGFRSLDLTEDLQIQDVLIPFAAGNFTFVGGPADPPSSLVDFDNFRTSNHFYGGQIGSRLNWCTGPFSVSWTTKVALGTTQQVVNIDGGSALINPGFAPTAVQGGVLAQPTNIGRYYHSDFSVVPETALNFGYQMTPWCRLQVGYTFLYWNNVVRPGNQVDRTVNPSQVPTDQNFGALTGPARPSFTLQTSDFWAQGINFGVEFRF